MDYSIRLATSGDVAHLPNLERAAAQRYIPYLEQLGLTPDMLEDIVPMDFLHQAQRQEHLWVAVPGLDKRSAPVGFVVVEPLPRGFFVVELDVALEYGRRGIGSGLMHRMMAAARHRQLDTVTLTTFRHVPWTIPFYRRLGFEIVAPGHYTPNIRAIVNHEERHGFSRRVRVVMQCQILPLT